MPTGWKHKVIPALLPTSLVLSWLSGVFHLLCFVLEGSVQVTWRDVVCGMHGRMRCTVCVCGCVWVCVSPFLTVWMRRRAAVSSLSGLASWGPGQFSGSQKAHVAAHLGASRLNPSTPHSSSARDRNLSLSPSTSILRDSPTHAPVSSGPRGGSWGGS